MNIAKAFAMARILLTNDDGVLSPGLWALKSAVDGLGDILVVAPERPRSAMSVSLTFHKPLRIRKVSVEGQQAYAASGNPADCVSLGVYHILKGELPDLVISGINPGDNTSAQLVFTSGTVAAAIQAAITGIPAVAFSVVNEGRALTLEDYQGGFAWALRWAKAIASWVLRRRLPDGIDFLNVNFPSEVSEPISVMLTKLARRRFQDFVVERKDPREVPYYWQWGTPVSPEEYQRGTDAYAVFVEKAISITPMSLDMARPIPQAALNELQEIMATIQL